MLFASSGNASVFLTEIRNRPFPERPTAGTLTEPDIDEFRKRISMSRWILAGTLMAAAVFTVLFEAYSMGQALHGDARVEIGRIIASENQDFCDRYRPVKAAASDNACADELMELRRRHERRASDVFYPGID